MKRTWLLVLAGLAAAWAGVQFGQRSQAPAPVAQSEAAVKQLLATTLKTPDGQPRTLTEWQGKLLVVNFWATWCPPCREEMPGFSRVQTKLAPSGVQVVGIAIDEAANVIEFNKKLAVAYPLLIAPAEIPGLMAKLGNPQQGLPFTLIVGRNGTLVFQHLGPLSEADLTQKLASLL